MTEREIQDLQEQSERGRKAKISLEFLTDFILKERADTINQLEMQGFEKAEDLLPPVLYLRILKKLEMTAQTYMQLGEISERELSKNGI